MDPSEKHPHDYARRYRDTGTPTTTRLECGGYLIFTFGFQDRRGGFRRAVEVLSEERSTRLGPYL